MHGLYCIFRQVNQDRLQERLHAVGTSFDSVRSSERLELRGYDLGVVLP